MAKLSLALHAFIDLYPNNWQGVPGWCSACDEQEDHPNHVKQGVAMQRPTWPNRMLMLAELWSRFSTCIRRKVGAVVYDPVTYAILGVGYNDTPIGEADCYDQGCKACFEGSVRNSTQCGCVHAEMNAILLSRADIRGAHLAIWNVKDGKVVVEAPCPSCHKNRIQAGITRVLIGDGDHFEYVEP